MSCNQLSVTVAVCTFARPALLAETLRCFVRQQYPASRFEILVVDNHPQSCSQTRAIVEGHGSEPVMVRYVREPHPGLSLARNRAIMESQSDIIVFSDDDLIAEAEWLTELLQPLEQDTPQVIGAVGGEVIPVYPGGTSRWAVQTYRPLLLRETAGPIGAQQMPMGANLAFRRKALEQVGMFDTRVGRSGTRLFAGDENRPLGRLREHGYQVWFAPRARVFHQMPRERTTLRHGLKQAHDSARSRVVARVASLDEQGETALGYLGTRLLFNALAIAPLALQGLAWACLTQFPSAARCFSRSARAAGYVRQTALMVLQSFQRRPIPAHFVPKPRSLAAETAPGPS